MKYLLLIVYVLTLGFLIFPNDNVLHAQVTSSSIAEQINLETPLPNGTIVCSTREGFATCNERYSTTIFGIVTALPAGQVIADATDEGTYIARTGTAQVRVSSANGPIVTGALITSSQTSGVGMRADRNGYVIGTALEDLSGDEGEILVGLNIHFTNVFADSRNNLLELLRESIATPILTPLAALRYILAAFVAVSAFVLGFTYFGRMARTGVEAVGRNPLAQRTITITIFFNMLIMFVIFVAGLMLSYLILTL